MSQANTDFGVLLHSNLRATRPGRCNVESPLQPRVRGDSLLSTHITQALPHIFYQHKPCSPESAPMAKQTAHHATPCLFLSGTWAPSVEVIFDRISEKGKPLPKSLKLQSDREEAAPAAHSPCG